VDYLRKENEELRLQVQALREEQSRTAELHSQVIATIVKKNNDLEDWLMNLRSRHCEQASAEAAFFPGDSNAKAAPARTGCTSPGCGDEIHVARGRGPGDRGAMAAEVAACKDAAVSRSMSAKENMIPKAHFQDGDCCETALLRNGDGIPAANMSKRCWQVMGGDTGATPEASPGLACTVCTADVDQGTVLRHQTPIRVRCGGNETAAHAQAARSPARRNTNSYGAVVGDEGDLQPPCSGHSGTIDDMSTSATSCDVLQGTFRRGRPLTQRLQIDELQGSVQGTGCATCVTACPPPAQAPPSCRATLCCGPTVRTSPVLAATREPTRRTLGGSPMASQVAAQVSAAAASMQAGERAVNGWRPQRAGAAEGGGSGSTAGAGGGGAAGAWGAVGAGGAVGAAGAAAVAAPPTPVAGTTAGGAVSPQAAASPPLGWRPLVAAATAAGWPGMPAQALTLAPPSPPVRGRSLLTVREAATAGAMPPSHRQVPKGSGTSAPSQAQSAKTSVGMTPPATPALVSRASVAPPSNASASQCGPSALSEALLPSTPNAPVHTARFTSPQATAGAIAAAVEGCISRNLPLAVPHQASG